MPGEDDTGPAVAKTVFIGGYMHSGTTLLGEVIANLPGSFRPARETKFLEFLPRYRQLHDVAAPDGEVRFRGLCRQLLTGGFSMDLLRPASGAAHQDGHSANGPDHLDLFLEECGRVLAEHDAGMLVEHTGTSIFGWPELVDRPECYLVEIVRDPRDVLASKKTRRATVFTDRYRPDQQRRKHYEKSFDPVWDTVSWRSFVRAGQQAALAMGPRYLRVRYEDLVADPACELERVAAVIGSAKPDVELSVSTNNSAEAGLGRSGIDAASVGRWRGALTPAEATLCELVARREMVALGYDTEAAAAGLALAPALAHAAVEPGVRLYGRFRLGGADLVKALAGNYVRRLRPGRAG